ncbi:MAG: Hsp20/alpha crystallin family protein [Desulfococcaceae bacterium]
MIYRRLFDLPAQGWKNPFEELELMKKRMEGLMGNFTGRAASQGLRAGVFPSLNLTEDKDNYYVRAELPGLDTADLDIQATVNSLSISGERKIPAEGENVRYHRKERESGRFSRVINLPEAVDTDKISAGLSSGILTVTVPKSEHAKPRQIKVN